jgi:hypothetical protein
MFVIKMFMIQLAELVSWMFGEGEQQKHCHLSRLK